MKLATPLLAGLLLVLGSLAGCAPSASGTPASVSASACRSAPPPKVMIAEFANTSSYYGVTVAGVESAATARLITLLKASGCYEVLEKSALLELVEEQGLESLAPEELAKAAGAAYLVTGTVTEVSIDRPQLGLFGVSVGSALATVKVDVRATDVITGEVVVSMTGQGSSQNASVRLTSLPVGPISFDNPEVGPLLAAASDEAVANVVAAIRQRF